MSETDTLQTASHHSFGAQTQIGSVTAGRDFSLNVIQLWGAIKSEENRSTVAWTSGGLAAIIIIGLWAAAHFSAPNVTASNCSIATGGSSWFGTYTAGNCPAEQKPAKP